MIPGSQKGMTSQPLALSLTHHSNQTSQCGEDGIIEAIFRHLEIEKGTAVEFGAWDGERHANTFALVRRGWRVALIEGDEDRFNALQQKTRDNPNVVALKAWVRPTGENSLDSILDRADVHDIDFLSVDIDGDDYHVLASLTRRPKVVCVEINPSIPPPVAVIGRRGTAEGSSIVAFDTLMRGRGYSLVHATPLNAFFVREDIADRFARVAPSDCFDYRHARFVISFYDGTNAIVDANGNVKRARNPWTGAYAALAIRSPKRARVAIAALAGAIACLVVVLLAIGIPG
ncbi:MAG: FkbM family methyltransferase [Propylenella sp.]